MIQDDLEAIAIATAALDGGAGAGVAVGLGVGTNATEGVAEGLAVATAIGEGLSVASGRAPIAEPPPTRTAATRQNPRAIRLGCAQPRSLPNPVTAIRSRGLPDNYPVSFGPRTRRQVYGTTRGAVGPGPSRRPWSMRELRPSVRPFDRTPAQKQCHRRFTRSCPRRPQ